MKTIKLTSDFYILQKSISKIFKIEDYFNLLVGIYSIYGCKDFDVIKGTLEKFNCTESAYITKGNYIKLMKWYDNNGRGNYGTPSRVYQEIWEKNFNENNSEWLINSNSYFYSVLGKNDFFKNVSKILEKRIGKQKLSEYILKCSLSLSNNSYDRNLSAKKYYTNKLEQIWNNKKEIYDIFNRDSLRTERNLINLISSL
jgi:hypothetical protein